MTRRRQVSFVCAHCGQLALRDKCATKQKYCDAPACRAVARAKQREYQRAYRRLERTGNLGPSPNHVRVRRFRDYLPANSQVVRIGKHDGISAWNYHDIMHMTAEKALAALSDILAGRAMVSG